MRLSATDFDLINGRCHDSLYGLVGFLFIQLISVPVSTVFVIWPVEENAFSINISSPHPTLQMRLSANDVA